MITGTHRPAALSAPERSASQHTDFDEQLVGFTINLHYTNSLDSHLRAIDQLADLGFNSVQIITPAYQTDSTCSQITIETGPGRGPTRQQLAKLLRHARSRVMHPADQGQGNGTCEGGILFTTP